MIISDFANEHSDVKIKFCLYDIFLQIDTDTVKKFLKTSKSKLNIYINLIFVWINLNWKDKKIYFKEHSYVFGCFIVNY